MPPKRTRTTDESPLEEGSASASPEEQVTLTEVLQILRLQKDEMRELIKTLKRTNPNPRRGEKQHPRAS
jgi:hypothetical protein